jgi:hypothetical protein
LTTGYPPEGGKYYTDKEVAGLLGISLGRLRNKLSAGQPLPPRIHQPPGCRNRLWSCEAVHDWLAQFTVAGTEPAQSQPVRTRGRPTKQAGRARRA